MVHISLKPIISNLRVVIFHRRRPTSNDSIEKVLFFSAMIRFLLQNCRLWEKKEEIWLSTMTKAPTPAEMSKGQSDNTNNANFIDFGQIYTQNLGFWQKDVIECYYTYTEFIGIITCQAKPLSIQLTNCLHIFSNVFRSTAKQHTQEDVPPKEFKRIITCLISPFNLITSIKSFDVSTLHASISHQKLKSRPPSGTL